ncbi:sigma factor-like helix-turn-helix DNA-binding protein [Motilibacter deserti]|uniref:RNA polymerase subunit sigma n=1 Tax=Motilibacter deserti TaxID=2714956 RepID=A0ABX0GX80_9ACTN|nr:RNA polymerase subunit sigma [Motilibacter deserti]
MRARDEDLLRALHEEHGAALWSYVVGLTAGDGARAQYVVEQTILRAWRSPELLSRPGLSARGWLFSTARHLLDTDHAHARRGPGAHVAALRVPAAARPSGDAAPGRPDRQLVLAALRELAPEHREVLVECHFANASVGQAADRLGLPPDAVKARIRDALHALRRAVTELGGLA